ncbi:hypothetical protein [Chryseobacterium wanjuense]
MVTVNDTLRKYSDMRSKTDSWHEDGDTYQKLTKNKNYATFAGKDGRYEIKAKLTDTLYFYSHRYFTQKYKVEDIIKKKINVQLKPEPCVPYVECKQKQPSNFYIFIGEKISATGVDDPYYCNVVTLDGGYVRSVYKIKEEIYGHYPKDTIEFKAYNHLGAPMFVYYDTALLFVGEYCGELYHERNQFFDLYKTKDGKWASPGDPYKFDKHQEQKTIKAQPIEFDPLVRIETTPPKDEDYPERFQKYEAPYYRFIGNKAVPLMGTYLEDLIKIKVKGSLKEKNIDLNKLMIK